MKSKIKNLISIVLFLSLLLSLIPFANRKEVEAATKFSKSTVTVKVGKKVTLKMTANGKRIANKKVKWFSKNKNIAEVSSKGVVTGVKKGKTTILGKYKGKKYTCKVNVISAKVPDDSESAENMKTDVIEDAFTQCSEERGIMEEEVYSCSANTAEDAYDIFLKDRRQKVIDSFLENWGSAFDYYSENYKFFDINNDGIKELLIETANKAAFNTTIYTFSKNLGVVRYRAYCSTNSVKKYSGALYSLDGTLMPLEELVQYYGLEYEGEGIWDLKFTNRQGEEVYPSTCPEDYYVPDGINIYFNSEFNIGGHLTLVKRDGSGFLTSSGANSMLGLNVYKLGEDNSVYELGEELLDSPIAKRGDNYRSSYIYKLYNGDDMLPVDAESRTLVSLRHDYETGEVFIEQ